MMLILGVFGCAKHMSTASQSIDSNPKQAREIPPATESALMTKNPVVSGKSVDQGMMNSKNVRARISLKDIYFDFDRSVIGPEMKEDLNNDSTFLTTKKWDKVRIEGYCDERGTNEYNLVLGNKRAYAVKSFLVAEGADGKWISTISYGKERPICHEHDENCYKLNRRAHFKMQ
ncbi:MAG: OmpA family protein [Nitrospirae bacterium]|nr:OmpA family protein [Nitrospirota bacterium]